LLRRKISRIMLTLLLVDTIVFTTNSFMRESAASDGGSIDWWPMFRHSPNHTGCSTSNLSLPIACVMNQTTYKEVRSSVAVCMVGSEAVVFACTVDGYVYSWRAEYPYTTRSGWPRKYNASSSPAVFEGRVCFGSSDNMIYALNASTGEFLWSCPTKGVVKSSPVIDRGALYVGSSDGYVYAINVYSGLELWRYWAVSAVESSPAVFNKTIFFGANDGRIYALEESGKVKWFNDTGGPVTSSPAVGYDKVFVGSNNSKVYAFDAMTGAPIWYTVTGGPVTSSPAVGYDKVFVGSYDDRLYALDIATGAINWSYLTGGPLHSSPALTSDNKVIFGSCDNKVYFFDVNGTKLWNFDTLEPVYSSPALAKDMVFVGSDSGRVLYFSGNRPPIANFTFSPGNPIVTQQIRFENQSLELDAGGSIPGCNWTFGDNTSASTTQAVIFHSYCAARIYNVTLTVWDNLGEPGTTWQLVNVSEAWPMFRHDYTHRGCSTSLAPVTNTTLWTPLQLGPSVGTDLMYPSPAVVGDLIFTTSTNGSVYAVYGNGTVKWANATTSGMGIYSSPAFADGLVWAGCLDGYIYAWQATNGEMQFRINVSTPTPIYSSPTVSGNKIFIGSQYGYLYSIDRSTKEVKNSLPLGGAIDSSPAVANGTVFVGSYDHKLYALDETNLSKIKWSYPTGDAITSSPIVVNDTVYVGSRDNALYAIDVNTHELRWKYATGGDIDSSLAFADGMVFAGSRDGTLYAFNAENGSEYIWKQPIGTIRWSSPAVAEGRVFVGTQGGRLFALDIADRGKEVWSYQTSGSVESSPAILNNTLYVGSQDGRLYAFSSWVHDVAVSNIAATPNSVTQGKPVNITLEVKNEGSYDEAINVTVDYNGTMINSSSISLTHGNRTTLIVPWDTSGVTPENYTISANSTLEIDDHPEDNSANCTVTVRSPAHDVAIVNVTTSKTGCILPNGTLMPTVGGNFSTWVNVTIENRGDYDETFNVYLFANNTSLTSWTINLASGESTRQDFNWSLKGYPKGNYTMSAVAELPSDDHPADNNFTDCWIKVTIDGDVNGDEKVDVKDVFAVAKAYGSVKPPAPSPPEHPWNPNCNINDDEKVDVKDYYIVNKRYGSVDP